MATQRQKVIRNDGGVQVVEVLSGGSSVVPAPTATTTGGVKLGATIAAPAAATATADTASTATDVAGLLADHNDLVTKYNALLADAAALRTTLASVLAQLKAQTIPAAS
ncbi:TPA: phenylalanyl-tRNA synthetase subunit beta [Serratia marcescens]